jgi:hypothetical protein
MGFFVWGTAPALQGVAGPKKKPRATAGLKLARDMKKDPTGLGPDPERLSQVRVWIATYDPRCSRLFYVAGGLFFARSPGSYFSHSATH